MDKSFFPNGKYVQQIEEQKQLIEYLKSKYREKTGYEPPIPENLVKSQVKQIQSKSQEKLSGIQENRSILIPQTKSILISKVQQSFEEEKVTDSQNTFYDALKELNLPNKTLTTKNKQMNHIRKISLTTFDVKNKYHMVQQIDLSNFKGKKFTRQAFRDFIEQVQEMRALHTLKLQNNGIDDAFSEELVMIITHTRIYNLDISYNEIGPKGMINFIQTMKEYGTFKLLDVSRNWFSSDLNTITNLCQALLSQKELLYIRMDAYRPPQPTDKVEIIYKGGDIICKMLFQHKNIQTAHIIDSSFTLDGIHLLQQNLINAKNHIIELNLKFCFLTREAIKLLAFSLQSNHSLVHLDLQQNAIDNVSGVYIAEMLAINHTLHSLNLEHNNLACNFIGPLCQSLMKNNVITILKLGYNYIGMKGAKQLLSILGSGNDTVEDLGQFHKNQITLGISEQILKKLTQNKIMQSNQKQNTGKKKTKQTHIYLIDAEGLFQEELANYKILKTIDLAASLQKNQINFRTWKI